MVSKVMNLDLDERKELATRALSSFMFIPFIAVIFFIPTTLFKFLCWGVYSVVAFEIFSQQKTKNIVLKIVALSFCLLGTASFINCREVFGPSGCGLLICISSSADIGAYMVGKLLKGPKLCPKISPKKTWAGFCGAFLFANLAFFCFKHILRGEISVLHATSLLTIQILIFAAILGDLVESAFKRKLSVKDMGKLFPGHGGILDRLDSLFMVSVVFSLLVSLHNLGLFS